MSWKFVFTLITATALLLNCAGSRPWVPTGFATYYDLKKCKGVCAVSPEGITWRVHRDLDQPQADLTFWKEALRKRMTDAGYRVLDSIPFTNQGDAGWALELSAPVGQADFTYLVGAVVRGHALLVIEASGASNDFANQRALLISSLSNANSD